MKKAPQGAFFIAGTGHLHTGKGSSSVRGMAEARSGVAVARRRRCRCFRIPGAGRALPPLWPACRVPAFLNGKRNGDAAQSGIPGSICGETAGKARDAQGPGSCRVSSGSPASVAAVHGTAFIRPVGGSGCRSPAPGPQRRDASRGGMCQGRTTLSATSRLVTISSMLEVSPTALASVRP